MCFYGGGHANPLHVMCWEGLKKKEMAGLGDTSVSHRPWGECKSESFPLNCTASWKWHRVMEGRRSQAFPSKGGRLAELDHVLPQLLPLPRAGKPTCSTGQLRAPSGGVSKGEGLRSLVAFYSHLPKVGIGLGPNKILLPFCCKTQQGMEAHEQLGTGGSH